MGSLSSSNYSQLLFGDGPNHGDGGYSGFQLICKRDPRGNVKSR